MGQSVSSAGADAAHRQVHGRREHPGRRRRRPRRRAGLGRDRPGRGRRLPARSATTRTRRSRRPPSSSIDGKRYSVPGDFAEVEADGTITLLGRGSVCINTGGEKVFPEEVEEALKTHESVRDAVAVGVPDEKFGEAITAVVELAPGAELDEPAIDRPREVEARRLQGAEAGARRSTRSAGPPTARSTTSASSRSRRYVCGVGTSTPWTAAAALGPPCRSANPR